MPGRIDDGLDLVRETGSSANLIAKLEFNLFVLDFNGLISEIGFDARYVCQSSFCMLNNDFDSKNQKKAASYYAFCKLKLIIENIKYN